MIKVKDIFEFLNQKFPAYTAMDFDNVGLLVGDSEQQVTRLLVALDCDKTAIEKAITNGCQLIVTHHPVIFGGIKSVTEESVVFSLLKHGISVISMHTNLDVGKGGVNDALCGVLGLENVETFIAGDGYALKKGEAAPVSAQDFAAFLRKKLGGAIKFTDSGKPVNKVLVCGGSGGEFLYELKNAECDTLVTADVKHNILIDAVNLGYNVFDAGHFATEDTVVEPLASLIRGQFSVLDVITHHPNIIYFA